MVYHLGKSVRLISFLRRPALSQKGRTRINGSMEAVKNFQLLLSLDISLPFCWCVHISIAWHSCSAGYVTLCSAWLPNWCYRVNPSFPYRYQRMHWIRRLRKPLHHQWRTGRAQSSMSREGHVLQHHWVVPLQVQAGLPWRWEVMLV